MYSDDSKKTERCFEKSLINKKDEPKPDESKTDELKTDEQKIDKQK